MSRALVLAVTVGCLSPGAALAQSVAPSVEAQRAEAAERFDRGLRLFNGGDTAGALAEFKRAYALIPNVLVLYNIGLVYAQMERPAEATAALEEVLAAPAGLSPGRIATAKLRLDEQIARTAEVTVTANVDGATVEIDGVEAGKLPLAKPLRVTSGSHVVGAVAAGYAPLRRELTIASREKQSMAFDFVPTQGRLAHLTVKTHLPGADVFADGQRIGTTPLSASFPLLPGAHRIELRRAGYTTASSDLTLGEGASGEVALEPEEDATALASTAGTVALSFDQTQVVVAIDGRPRGVYGEALRLAPGPHHLVAERGNFEPVESDFSIDSGRTTSLQLVLVPTPEYRAQFVSKAQTQRTWGVVAIVAGAAVTGAAAAVIAYDASQRNQGNAALASLQAQSTFGSDEACDMGQAFTALTQRCTVPRAAANSKVSDADTRDIFGWSAAGAGVAGLVLGIVLVATADDPHRYDRAQTVAPRPAPASAHAEPALWTMPGGGGVSVVGAF